MNWQFGFYAQSKETAKKALELVDAPAFVKEFISQALDGLHEEWEAWPGIDMLTKNKIVSVKSEGRLAMPTDQSIPDTSSFQAEVKYTYVIPDSHFATG